MFRLAAQLLELHDENPFKIRTYQNAVAALERVEEPLSGMSAEQLAELEGIGKSLASKLLEINETGSFAELDQLRAKTPPGVVSMLDIKGIGPKKIRTIWKELGVTTTEALLQACENNELSKVKGFGAKTQEAVKQALLFVQQSRGKLLYAEAEHIAKNLLQFLKNGLKTDRAEVTGEFRRCLEIIETLQVVVGHEQPAQVLDLLNTAEPLEQDEAQSGPFVWRGLVRDSHLKVEVKVVAPEQYVNQLFLHTGSLAHLRQPVLEEKSLLQLVQEEAFETETAIYAKAGMYYVAPELREGTNELELAKENKLPVLLELSDLKGILHNHSTYSDGSHTLEQMATACRGLGYQYLGISDHSRTAAYAGGLQIHDVQAQHAEIDILNQKLAPFKVFKGIESDILGDGSLDYPDEVLATFDFVVASIHSNLSMDVQKATERLLRAIENPYTTILGHPTGRLLLRREGYPIHHKAVIDACAANNVVIEINANPWRLDLDWRWVQYALEQGVMLSINPDAHATSGYADMRYGVLVGRKGGLTKEQTLNAMGLQEIEQFFAERKKGKGI